MARYPTALTSGGVVVESDPVAVARLDDLGLTFATDAEMAAAVAALQAADVAKQDAATAATDAEVAAARAAVEAAMATDSELASAVATLQAADALAQAAATAATDAELAAVQSTLNAAVAAKQDSASAATDTELNAAIANLNTALAAKQESATAATDAELAAAVANLNAALDALDVDLSTEASARAAADALKQDASAAATDAELASSVATLNAAIAAKADAATTSTDAERDAAIEAHRIDTTDVHGIADTALVLERGEAYGSSPWVPGRWYAIAGTTTQTQPANSDLVVSPFPVPAGQRIDSFGWQIVTAGEAGSLVDLFIWADNGFTYPGPRLAFFDAIPGDVSGVKQMDLPAPITPGATAWIGARFYNAPTTRPTIRSAPQPQIGLSAPDWTRATPMLGAGYAGFKPNLAGAAAIYDALRAGTAFDAAGVLPPTDTRVVAQAFGLRTIVRAAA